MARLRRSGEVTFLRVHDRGGYGPPDDFLSEEAIGAISSEPDHRFGVFLRDDDNLPAHEGMLALLRDGLLHDVETTVEYDLEDTRKHGSAIRVELRRK